MGSPKRTRQELNTCTAPSGKLPRVHIPTVMTITYIHQEVIYLCYLTMCNQSFVSQCHFYIIFCLFRTLYIQVLVSYFLKQKCGLPKANQTGTEPMHRPVRQASQSPHSYRHDDNIYISGSDIPMSSNYVLPVLCVVVAFLYPFLFVSYIVYIIPSVLFSK